MRCVGRHFREFLCVSFCMTVTRRELGSVFSTTKTRFPLALAAFGGMDKTKASTNTSGKPHHAWTSSAPGIAKRQTSDWFARKSHGDYARVPKLSPTTDDGSASSRANSQMSLDSGPDRSSTSGVLFDDMNKEEREKMMATVNGISEVDSRNGTVFGDYKSAVKLARKNSDVLSGESSRVAQRLARLTSPPSSTGTAGSNTGNVKTANLISFREEQPNEPTDLLWLEADSKPTQTASEASRPMFLDSATPKSLSNGICDVKNTRPRTSLETIRQQIRQIESEIRVSNGHRQPPPPSSASSAPHHHPPKTPSQLLAQVNDEERDDDEDGFLGPSFSRPIQPSYSSQSIPANFDSHLVGDFGGGARRRGGSTYGGQQNRTAGHPAFPQSSMQRAYSVDVAVHSAISDIQSAVRRNSMIRLKSSTQTLNRASIDEAPEDDCVWVKRESSAQTDMQQAPHEPRLSGPAGPPLMVPPPPLPTNSRLSSSMTPETDEEMENESRQLLSQENGGLDGGDHCANRIGSLSRPMSARRPSCQSAHDLIEGVLFRCCYLGSTHLFSDSRPTKSSRLNQAQEAVTRIKAPDGESQPMTDVDLFISMEKIMVLNVDIQESLMDHPLRTISYIADIGDLVVLMVKRGLEDLNCDAVLRSTQPKMLCHVFQSDEASMIAQTIGNAFQVAYMEYLKANGIQDDRYLRHLDYLEVLNSQEMSTNELDLFASKDKQINVVIPKQKGEILGVVIVESGWGSMLPTVIIANLCPGGPGARCGKLSIGDQLISINGISLVGLPLAQCQTTIKNAKNLTVVKLTIVSCPPVVEVKIKRPDTRYQLGFSVQNGIICSLLRGGIAERGGIRVGHRIIEINSQSVVATDHENIVNMLAHSVGAIELKTMPSSIFRLLTGQDTPVYI